ncbi:hypothetical protein [Enemella sp. A6]|uniref:hypothetical protein n=1 Tax=Enemella sp. A6 TaxID=3440152 RepID=UPI003EBFCFA9
MPEYTMNQWDSFVGELDGAFEELAGSFGTVVETDNDNMPWYVAFWEWANMIKVEGGAVTGTSFTWRSDWISHMTGQLNAANGHMKEKWQAEFDGFKRIPKFLYEQSEKWSDLVPKLQTADEELRSSTTNQNWVGAGAEAYFETQPKQLNAIADMAQMANNAATQLRSSAEVMAGQYAWALASVQQLTNAVDDIDGGMYPRSTSLAYWLLDFAEVLEEVASGIGQSWNSAMQTPVTTMGDYASQNNELKQPDTWPKAANLDGDFDPIAPQPGMPGGQPPGAPPMPGPPPGTTPPPTQPTVEVPGGGPGGAGGPLDLEAADGHKDSGSASSR